MTATHPRSQWRELDMAELTSGGGTRGRGGKLKDVVAEEIEEVACYQNDAEV